ncbi:hypothetical protein OH77DRAFT_395935 [Trametes cingulata]|nr:hypothetical protein OH77DRAFT_395935 [Trametes cingulata]
MSESMLVCDFDVEFEGTRCSIGIQTAVSRFVLGSTLSLPQGRSDRWTRISYHQPIQNSARAVHSGAKTMRSWVVAAALLAFRLEDEQTLPRPHLFNPRFLWLLDASLTQSARLSGPLDVGGRAVGRPPTRFSMSQHAPGAQSCECRWLAAYRVRTAPHSLCIRHNTSTLSRLLSGIAGERRTQ